MNIINTSKTRHYLGFYLLYTPLKDK